MSRRVSYRRVNGGGSGPSNLIFDYPLIQTGDHVRVDLNAMLICIDGSLVYIDDGDILLRLPQ